MTAKVYTLDTCSTCKQLVRFLVYSAAYRCIEIIDIMKARDTDAMSEVQIKQGGDFPLLMVDDARIPPKEYTRAMAEWVAAGRPEGWAHEWGKEA